VDLGVCFQALNNFLSFSDTFVQFSKPARFIHLKTGSVYASTELVVDLTPISFSPNENVMSGQLTSPDRRVKVELHKEGDRTRLCTKAQCIELLICSRRESLLSAQVSELDFNDCAGSRELLLRAVITATFRTRHCIDPIEVPMSDSCKSFTVCGLICRRPDIPQNLTGLHDARRIASPLLADIVSPGHETIHQSVNFGALIALLAHHPRVFGRTHFPNSNSISFRISKHVIGACRLKVSWIKETNPFLFLIGENRWSSRDSIHPVRKCPLVIAIDRPFRDSKYASGDSP
jgi:hypothetical protein